jgi:predicted RNase H-like HicB family nuclease
MKSGDILHMVWRTPALIVRSGSPSGIGASLMRTGAPNVLKIAGPAATTVTSTDLLCPSRHSNRSQPCQWVAPGSSAFLAPMPTGIFSERPGIGVAPPKPAPIATKTEKTTKVERIELAIDSLQGYDLIKPIPVLIESLGDKVFVAEAPDLNFSTTGNSVGAAFLLLKEQIITTYEGDRSKKGPDPQRNQQLATLEQYIGKPRRHWF